MVRELRPMCVCGKIGYDKRGAITARNFRWKTDRVPLREYQCEFSNLWHLTHTNPYSNKFDKEERGRFSKSKRK